MVNVRTEITIHVPLEKVADYAANPDNAPEWYVNKQLVEWKTPPPLTIGSKLAFIAYFLGRKLAYTYEIVEFEAQKKLVMRTAEGPFPMETSYTWTRLDENSTLMTLNNSGIPSGFSKLMAPFMSMAMRRANTKDLKNIKRILEQKN